MDPHRFSARVASALLACFLGALPALRAATHGLPLAADPGVTITLFAEHPSVVTPTGIAADGKGRVFVIENQTHHRPDDYDGPKADRILVFRDEDGDGRADKRTIFYEGLIWGTDLAISPEGWIYASTRSEIHRLRDTDNDNIADEFEGVIDMETAGTYPHNGISGICFDRDGRLHFGLGENLGHDYTLVGRDGTRLSGGGEGGSMYRCHPDGSGLQRIATGVWNPFGMGFDTAGNLFATDNDPGDRPPCRLLHVTDGADFGYEYRYGRTGNHPLITWTGEFPGTVGMVCGTGEAPCGVIAFGPGKLLVASWADHRIDRYNLAPKGASFTAERKEFIAGGNEFRPVDLTAAPDGVTFYFSDWVSSSYPVHGQGRIWKFTLPEPLPPGGDRPHPEIIRAGSIHTMKEAGHIPGLLQLLEEPDPFIRSAAIAALARMGESLLGNLPTSLMRSPRQRAGVLVALKRSGAESAAETLPVFLQDEDEEVRFCAVKWIADAELSAYRPSLEEQLRRPGLSIRMFLATMAALDRLDGKKPVDVPSPERLRDVVFDAGASPALRALALRLIPPGHKTLSLDQLAAFLTDRNEDLRREAVRNLMLHPDERRGPHLAALARDPGLPAALRADAVAGLALLAEQYADLLKELADGDDPILRDEALRALVGVPGLQTRHQRDPGAKPPPVQLVAWDKLLGERPGDPDAGRRIFFHSKVGTCFRCHTIEGRGVRVGPDLTTIWKRAGGEIGEDESPRAWLLESILQPSAAIAPQFLPWEITLKDGTTRLGLPLRKGGTAETYIDIAGNEFSLKKPDIESHRELPTSLMPAGLLEQLTAAEARDLLAYLMAPK